MEMGMPTRRSSTCGNLSRRTRISAVGLASQPSDSHLSRRIRNESTPRPECRAPIRLPRDTRGQGDVCGVRSI
eukprot:1501052-Pyramimonas_sp.AAC.1